jgi:iron complex transport system substrate-binding protein
MLLLAWMQDSAAAPQRVMSLNLCSDQLLLDLLPPDRITSVTYLSREPNKSYLSAAAYQVGINHGAAEEVVSQRPDLVIAGIYTTPATRLLIKQVGIPLLELDSANNFQQIRDITRRIGRAVGAEAKAEELLQKMDATLAQLAATAPRQPIRIVGWNGAGSVEGTDTLFDAIISAAGAINLGAMPGLRATYFGTEQLLMVHPDLLAFGDATVATASLHSAPILHPAVRARYAGREIVYPELLYSCGLPESAQAALQIRQVMQQVLHGTPAR